MIEFIEDCHVYLNDGVIIPSVSALCRFALNEDFSMIPKHILKKAQEFGTKIHNAIELYLTEGKITEFDEIYLNLAFEQFMYLKDEIKNPTCEQMLDYEGRYAGRYDILDGDVLIDVKTNSKIDIPHLEVQLSFYAMALESKGIKVNRLRCLWLPKRKGGQWVEIRRIPNEILLEILNQYEIYNANKGD